MMMKTHQAGVYGPSGAEIGRDEMLTTMGDRIELS